MGLITYTTAIINNNFKNQTTFTWAKFRGVFIDLIDGFTNLLSTDNGKGASQVGVEDAAGATTAANVEAWLVEHAAFLQLPAADGTHAKRYAQFTFDPTANSDERTQAIHQTTVTLPDNAIVTRMWYEVLTTFTSTAGGTDKATIAMGFATDDVAGLVAAVAIETGTPWDAGFHEGIQDGAAANFSNKLTAARPIDITVGVCALTGGKLIGYVEYVVSV